jgi:hypothetical protein
MIARINLLGSLIELPKLVQLVAQGLKDRESLLTKFKSQMED